MEIKGEYRLSASRETVWKMLNDVSVLRECIPGCEELEQQSDTEMTAKIMAAIGPVKSRFSTKIQLRDLNTPERYTIAGEAKSGAAGFGRGQAVVTLAEDGDTTVLTYDAELKVGGKLAQIGSRLVAGATRKTADEFFDKFAAMVDPGAEKVQQADATASGGGLNKFWLLVALAAAAALGYWLLT